MTRAASLERKREERSEKERREEKSRLALAKKQHRRRKAATVIQAVWRGATGRVQGGARARRKLRTVLVDLGGGKGRMHRWGGESGEYVQGGGDGGRRKLR